MTDKLFPQNFGIVDFQGVQIVSPSRCAISNELLEAGQGLTVRISGTDVFYKLSYAVARGSKRIEVEDQLKELCLFQAIKAGYVNTEGQFIGIPEGPTNMVRSEEPVIQESHTSEDLFDQEVPEDDVDTWGDGDQANFHTDEEISVEPGPDEFLEDVLDENSEEWIKGELETFTKADLEIYGTDNWGVEGLNPDKQNKSEMIDEILRQVEDWSHILKDIT